MKQSQLKQLIREILDEIKINKPYPNHLLPIVKLDGEFYVIDYNNLIENIIDNKNRIAKYLNITDENQLKKFLTFYVNTYSEVEHQGDQEMYVNLTWSAFLQDIEGYYEATKESPEDWEPIEDDDYTEQEVFGK